MQITFHLHDTLSPLCCIPAKTILAVHSNQTVPTTKNPYDNSNNRVNQTTESFPHFFPKETRLCQPGLFSLTLNPWDPPTFLKPPKYPQSSTSYPFLLKFSLALLLPTTKIKRGIPEMPTEPLRHLLLTVAALAFLSVTVALDLPTFREAPAFRNGQECPPPPHLRRNNHFVGTTIHIAMTLDATYLRGSIAGVFSVLQHASCPENIVFHFIATSHRRNSLRRTISSTFPYLNFKLYQFEANLVKNKISYSIRRALDQPLNYARIYLADLLDRTVRRIIYFDSDLILVDDVAKLWKINLGKHVLGAPEYCHANLTSYFNERFWETYATSFEGRNACYFNTGVMVIDLVKWREGKYRERLEHWMRVQKKYRIYELGSLPPFLLVFGGDVEGVEHRWNQHGLGGDNVEGLCRDLHPGPVSLLHWSGKGKPWLRIDAKKPCPLDSLWAPYDLYRHKPLLFSDS